MDNERINEILLRLLEDVSVIRTKMDMIEEIKTDARILNTRVDNLEAENRELKKTTKSLERRSDTMEQFVRDQMNDTKKTQQGLFISMGMCIFGAIVSFVINMF